MNFKEFFSFDEHVIPWVAEQIKNASRKKENSSEETTTKERCNAHIVGQVSYKEFIFTWDGRPDKIEKEITHFCTYNLETKEFSILFKHQKVDVVSASLNEERILLAFTVIDYKSPPDDHAKEKLGIYQSLVAEISPPKDVFKLADDHTHGCGCQYQKVEFLYGNYPLYLESSRRESHLLYFVHSKSIDLFHIPLKKINSATLISGNPQVEHLVKKFVWSQFDRSEKRLHYVYSESDDENSLDGLVFSTLQFCEGSRQVPTLKVTCPFFVCSPYQTRFLYNRNPLSKCISESNINMQLVTSHDGSIFLCYQHPIDAHKKSTITQNCEEVVADVDVDDFDGESDSRTTFLEYSVFMLHFGSILKCKVPNVVPEDLVPHCRLLFTMLDDCVAVMLPGYIFHMLDCGAEHPPCNHVLLSGQNCRDLISIDQQLLECLCVNNVSKKMQNREELLLFEPTLEKLFILRVKNSFWTDCFRNTHCYSTRLALLHFCILHIQDADIIVQMFCHLASDPANPECLELLKEYLICSTYFQMKFQVESKMFKLFPFSNAEPFRGHLETSRLGEKIAKISYSFQEMLKENEILKPFKDEKRKELDFWTSFYENIYFHNSYHRFSLKEVSLTKERLQSNQSNVSSKSENVSTSIFQQFRKMPSVESQIQGNVEFSKDYRPEYLEMIESDKDTLEKEEGRNMMVLKSLTKFLHLCLPPEVPKMKIQKIALEYITCQKKQSSYLLQLFWYSLKYSEDCHPYDEKIKIRGTIRDRALFMLFERYYMAVNEINFPVSKGFHTFFVFIGFRCLHQSFFMQYVRNKVFNLETEFMHRLIHDVGDDESYFQLISRLISQFDQSTALNFMLMWRGFGVSSVLCQRYLSNMLSNGSSLESIPRDFFAESEKFPVLRPSGSFSSTDPSLIQKQAESIYFRPLLSVMTSIKVADAKQKKQNTWKKKVVESDAETNSKLSFISDNALEHTIRAIDDSSALEAF